MFKSEFGDEVSGPLPIDGLPSAGQEPDLTIARGGSADMPPADDLNTFPIVASPERRGGDRGAHEAAVAGTAGDLAAGAALGVGPAEGHDSAHSKNEPAEQADEPVAGSAGGGDVPPGDASEQASSSPEEEPDPDEVARRVAEATGRAKFNPDVPAEIDTPIKEIGFDIAPGVAADTAVIRVRHSSEEKVINHKGEEHPARETEADAVIGHYDPAARSWKFYPEFVPAAQQGPLAAAMEANAEVTQSHIAVEAEVRGSGMMDVRHPVTVAAHQEIAAHLSGTGLIEALPERRGRRIPMEGEQFQVDEATSATCTIQLGVDGRFRDDGEQDRFFELHVTYRGLRAGNTEDGTVERADFSIKVASRPIEDPVWQPNEDLVTPEEWDILAGIPDILARYETIDPDFSVRDCAVFRNWS